MEIMTNTEYTKIKEETDQFKKDNIPGILQSLAEQIDFHDVLIGKFNDKILKTYIIDTDFKRYIENKERDDRNPMALFKMPLESFKSGKKRLESYRDHLIKELERVEK